MFLFNILTIFIYFNYVIPSEVSQTCSDLRDTFADASSEFSACAIRYSRPITLCENCVDSYLDVLGSYQNMSKLIENGTKCIDNFINLDRLQIIETLYRNNIDLWLRAKCYMCFQEANGVVTPTRSNQTLKFNTYYNRMMTCYNKTRQNNTIFCSDCLDHYVTLNDYYNSISNENEKIGVCMDIVDMMNDTRILWSQRCCTYRRHEESICLACIPFVLSTIVFFYVLAKIYSEKKTPTIMQQRRFAESLSQADLVKNNQDEEQ